jgi:hypothetical protein
VHLEFATYGFDLRSVHRIRDGGMDLCAQGKDLHHELASLSLSLGDERPQFGRLAHPMAAIAPNAS